MSPLADRPRAEPWLLCGVVLLALGFYAYVFTLGFSPKRNVLTAHFDAQAQGFVSGHLFLSTPVNPELLRIPDPFNRRNLRLWVWDLSLFEGRYYMYWGPLPALLLVPLKLLGVTRVIGDDWLTLVATALCLLLGTRLAQRLVQLEWPTTPTWLLLVGVVVFALANPAPWMLADPAVYQASTCWGQAGLLAGLLAALEALHAPTLASTNRAALVACTTWALALGARWSLVPAVGLLLLGLAWALHREGRLSLRLLLVGTGPLLAVVGGLMAFNFARFGSPFETGVSTQLDTIEFHLSWDRVPANLFGYLLRAPELQCGFPFVRAATGAPIDLTPEVLLPSSEYYSMEPLIGLIWAVPWLGLTVPTAVWFVARWRGPQPQPRLHRFVGLCFLAASVPLVPVLAVHLATMRYGTDVRSALVVLGFMGACFLWQGAAGLRWLRGAVAGLVVSLALLTAGLGVLLALQGYGDRFHLLNQDAYQALERLKVCHATKP